MEIQIKRRDVYGIGLIYVCNSPAREAITTLTKKKTIDEKDIEALKNLGHTIYDVDAEIKKLIGRA